MAQENFLINPPKRLSRRKNPIGETLVMIGANPSRRNPMSENLKNPWHGDSNGHRIAALMRWGKLPQGKVKRYRKRGRPSLHGFVVKRRKPSVKRHVTRKRKHIGLGLARAHSAIASGAARTRPRHRGFASVFGAGRPGGKAFGHNPYLGRLFMRKRRRSAVKKNAWFGQPRRHRKAAKKGWRKGHLLSAGRKRARRVKHNPVMANPFAGRVRRRRSIRQHNPVFGGAMIGKFTGGVMDIRGWAPLAVTGAVSAITGAVVPQMIGVINPWAKLGVQTAIAIGGGIVVEQTIDKRHGQAWMVVGVAMVGYQLLKQFVLVPYLPQFAVGLGDDYQDYSYGDGVSQGIVLPQGIEAFPGEMSAFPGEMSAYPGVGESQEVGSYPYDGSGY